MRNRTPILLSNNTIITSSSSRPRVHPRLLPHPHKEATRMPSENLLTAMPCMLLPESPRRLKSTPSILSPARALTHHNHRTRHPGTQAGHRNQRCRRSTAMTRDLQAAHMSRDHHRIVKHPPHRQAVPAVAFPSRRQHKVRRRATSLLPALCNDTNILPRARIRRGKATPTPQALHSVQRHLHPILAVPTPPTNSINNNSLTTLCHKRRRLALLVQITPTFTRDRSRHTPLLHLPQHKASTLTASLTLMAALLPRLTLPLAATIIVNHRNHPLR